MVRVRIKGQDHMTQNGLKKISGMVLNLIFVYATIHLQAVKTADATTKSRKEPKQHD